MREETVIEIDYTRRNGLALVLLAGTVLPERAQ